MGLDQHRAQITADWVDTSTGEMSRARVAPADRAGVGWFLVRFGDRELEVALEATTGWRFVVEELRGVGAVVHLAEPAETAARRGSKKCATNDRADARHPRELLMVSRRGAPARAAGAGALAAGPPARPARGRARPPRSRRRRRRPAARSARPTRRARGARRRAGAGRARRARRLERRLAQLGAEGRELHDTLAEQQVAHPPAWARALFGERPAHPRQAEQYDRGVREAARYRIEHDVPDDAPALGPEPTDGRYRGAWRQTSNVTRQVQRRLGHEAGRDRDLGIER
jgi:hypothetical protein